MHQHGKSIDYLEKLASTGRATALNDKPELTQDENELWEMYCFMGSDILVSTDIYDRKIGLPFDWDFRSCVVLMSKMKRRSDQLIENDQK